MPSWAYLTLAIALIAVLLAVFLISFVAYRKTPPPKGCERIKVDEEVCGTCAQAGCPYKADLMAENKKQEEKKEK
jgi:hypothetical protein